MFSIFKKSSSKVDLSWLGTDMHSHLVPGIDDGAQDMSASLEFIRGLHQLGYSKIITTPHILWEIYPNTPEIIKKGTGEVNAALTDAGIDVKFEAAAEYFIDEHFEQELENKTPLLPISDNLVLVEFSMINAPMDLHDVLFEMQMQNYQPVLAHPERYVFLKNNPSFFEQLRNSGCLFQLNLLSLTGYYGQSVLELAEYLVKKDFYDYAGTDLHHDRHLAHLHRLSASSCYARLKDSGVLRNHSL